MERCKARSSQSTWRIAFCTVRRHTPARAAIASTGRIRAPRATDASSLSSDIIIKEQSLCSIGKANCPCVVRSRHWPILIPFPGGGAITMTFLCATRRLSSVARNCLRNVAAAARWRGASRTAAYRHGIGIRPGDFPAVLKAVRFWKSSRRPHGDHARVAR